MKKDLFKNFYDKPLNEESFFALIEIEKGSKKKYECDLDTGFLYIPRLFFP